MTLARVAVAQRDLRLGLALRHRRHVAEDDDRGIDQREIGDAELGEAWRERDAAERDGRRVADPAAVDRDARLLDAGGRVVGVERDELHSAAVERGIAGAVAEMVQRVRARVVRHAAHAVQREALAGHLVAHGRAAVDPFDEVVRAGADAALFERDARDAALQRSDRVVVAAHRERGEGFEAVGRRAAQVADLQLQQHRDPRAQVVDLALEREPEQQRIQRQRGVDGRAGQRARGVETELQRGRVVAERAERAPELPGTHAAGGRRPLPRAGDRDHDLVE